MNTNSTVVITVLVIFLIVNAVIIRLNHKQQDTVDEYAVGGRGLSWILVCFSYVGSWYVGAIYVGWVASAADIGIFAQYLGIYSIGGLITMYMMSSNVWTWGKVYNLDSIAAFIKLRYQNPAFARFFSIIIIAVNFFWLVVEMVTIGYVVSVATNGAISFGLGTVIGSGFVLVYTFIGGTRATAFGNLVQGATFGILGTIVFIFLIFKSYGGPTPLFEMLEAHQPQLLSLEGYEGLWMSSILTGILGAYVWPQIFNRMFMTKGAMESKKAVYIAPLLIIVTTFGILWSGMGLRLLDNIPDNHQYGLFFVANAYGGPVILGLVGCFAVAASMSTISAVSHACGVMLGEEFICRPDTPEEKRVKILKASTISLGIISMIVALFDWGQLNMVALAMYEFIIQGFVSLFLGVLWKKGNVQGAFFGMLAGVIIAFLGFFGVSFAWAGGLSAGCVGLIVNLIVYLVCAKAFGPMPIAEEMWEKIKLYDQYGNLVEDNKLPMAS